MKKLFIMWGPQGSGKTAAIRAAGLSTTAKVSARAIMEQVCTWVPSVGFDRTTGPQQGRHTAELVDNAVLGIVEAKMHSGETVCVDAQHATHRPVRALLALAERYGYDPVVVDCHTWKDDATLLEGISSAGLHAPADPQRVLADWRNKQPVPKVRVIRPEAMTTEVAHTTTVVPDTISQVVVIGDVQSCAAPLRSLIGQYDLDATLFVFVGDLFDRGPDPVGTYHLVTRLPHKILVEGNHDWNLRQIESGNVDKGFVQTVDTFAKLQAGKVSRIKIRRLLNRMVPYVDLDLWGEHTLFVSHAGALPDVITTLRTKGINPYPDHAFIYGPDTLAALQRGKPSRPEVDRLMAMPGTIQVHGHYRHDQPEVTTTSKGTVINLEGGVEHGNPLSAVVFTKGAGWAIVHTPHPTA